MEITEAELRALYGSGLSIRKIADRIGMSHSCVRARMRQYGIEARPNAPLREWNAPLEELYRRYHAGEPAESLARAEGTSGQVLVEHFRKQGWSIRTSAEATALWRARSRTELDETQLRELYEHMSMAEIAEHLGTTHKIVETNMQRYGIERRECTWKSQAEGNTFWRGGYTVDKHGYILVRRPEHPESNKSGYVRVHRLVVEERLDRPLTTEEVVDHRDGDTSNNEPSNLRLFATNAEHLAATKTGSHQLSPEQREALRRRAVQRAHQRVAATLEASRSDDSWSHAAWPRPSTAPRKAARRPSGTAPRPSRPARDPRASTKGP